MKIDCLIWTKDRTAQLDLLLRSVKNHFENIGNVFVLCDYSNGEFKKGFDKIKNKDYGLNISIIYKTNHEQNTKDIINNKIKTDFMLCLCDDDVFIRKTNIDEIIKEFKEDVCAVSFRLSEKINYCLATRKFISIPKFIPCNNFLKWRRISDSKGNPDSYWGFGFCVNSHIYKTGWFRKIISNLHFNVPTVLEGLFLNNKHLFNPNMLSFKKSRVLNIPVNKVSPKSTCYHGKIYPQTPAELNKKFLEGYVIDTSNIYGLELNTVVTEIKFNFIKEK